MNTLGQYLETTRRERGLSPQALARRVGYRNVNRGARRILKIERGGAIDPELFEKLIEGLGLDRRHCETLAREDRARALERFQAWLAVPVAPEFYLVPLAVVWAKRPIPASARHDRDAAEAFALRAARERNSRAILIWDRRWTLWISRDGSGFWQETTLESWREQSSPW